MGFIECRIARSPARTELVADGTRIRVSDAQADVLMRSDSPEVTVGIRPERLALASVQEGQSADVAIRGRVEAVEMLGSEQYVHTVVDGGAVTARVPRSQRVRADDSVTLKAEANDVHLFERATGRALR
jgi:ABC-type sugar transport system ATPase subunit